MKISLRLLPNLIKTAVPWHKIKQFLLITMLIIGSINLYSDSIIFSANNMKSGLGQGRESTVLKGNAYIESGDVTIRGDEITLYGKDYTYVVCKGNILVINKESGVEIVCENLFMDRDLDMIRIQGNAIMEDKKNDLVLKGGFIENWQKEDLTIIQIGVRILKEDMVCRAESVRYFRDRDYMELSGMPLVVWKGDTYNALKINIDLENDEVNMEGNVQGDIVWDDDDPPVEGEGDGSVDGVPSEDGIAGDPTEEGGAIVGDPTEEAGEIKPSVTQSPPEENGVDVAAEKEKR